jgi:SNF2 family DNA or RNA helicase
LLKGKKERPVSTLLQDFCRQGQFLFTGDLGRILFPFPMERGSQKSFMDAFAFWVEKTMKTGKRRKVQEAERIKNADLFWRITDTLMIRRANEDEMVAEAIQLPHFTEREVAVEPSDEQLQVIRWVEGKFLQLYRRQLERERRGESFDLGSFSALMWAARRAATVPSCFRLDYPQEEWPDLKTWPKLEAIEKVAATCMAEGRKLVIFTGLNPAAEELVKRLAPYGAAPIPLTHTTTPAKRTKILRAFRMEDSPRIVVMGLLCGNVGLTLTSPKHPIDVLVADLDWSPSQIAQAIKRVYRPSQKYPVSAYTVLTNRSMDMDMLDLVYRKSKGIAQALDKVDPDDVEKRAPLSQREMLDELAKRIEERQAREAVEKVSSLLDQNKPIEAVPNLKAALNLQMVPWDEREARHRLARKSLEQAMFLNAAEKD